MASEEPDFDALVAACGAVTRIDVPHQPPMLVRTENARKWAGAKRNVTMAWRLLRRATGEIVCYFSSADVLAALLGVEKNVVLRMRADEDELAPGMTRKYLWLQPQMVAKDEPQVIVKMSF